MQTAYQAQKDTGNIKWKPKWQNLGQMYALTSFDSLKGATTANNTLMVLDEFIKEKRVPPYPSGCVDMLMNMWETFDRRENRVILVGLANNADLVNPLFQAWGITPSPGAAVAISRWAILLCTMKTRLTRSSSSIRQPRISEHLPLVAIMRNMRNKASSPT